MTYPSDCDPQVIELLQEIEAMPEGLERVRRCEHAVSVATRLGGFDNEYWTRLYLIDSAYHVPNDPSLLTHYSWLRRALDTAGERLDEEDRRSVLWRLKWALTQVVGTPEIPLETARATIDDVEGAFRAHGAALRPIHQHRAALADEIGERAEAGAHLDRWVAASRDDVSDCHACECREQARLVADGDPERALTLIQPVVDGSLTCGEEPQSCLAYAAEWHTRLGQRQEAAAAYQRGWRLSASDPKAADAVGRQLVALTRIGNVDRAVDHLLPRLEWLPDLTDPGEREVFLAAGAFVLTVAEAAGLAPAEINGRPVTEVAADLRSQAYAVAAAFDRRNGSQVHTQRVDALLDVAKVSHEPVLPPLRLAVAGEGAGSASDPEAAALPMPSGVTAHAKALRERIDALDIDVEPDVQAWLAHRGALRAQAGPGEWGDVAFLDRIAAAHQPPARRDELLADALAAAERAVDQTQRLRVLVDQAVAQGVEPDSGEAAAVATLAEALDTSGALEDAGAAWLAIARHTAGPALAEYDRAAELFGRAARPWRQALVLLEGARGEADPALIAARIDAAQAHAGSGAPATLQVLILDARSRLAAAQGDLDTAIDLASRAVDLAGDLPVRVPVRDLLADLLVDDSRWDELEPVARLLVRDAQQRRDPVLLALAQRYLGVALVELGSFAEAAELLEASLARATQDLPHLVGPIGWALGNALSALGEPGGARTAYTAAAVNFEATGRPGETGHAQFRAGSAAWDAGDAEAAAAHFDAAAAHARQAGDAGLLSGALRQLAALRVEAGELVEGVADLDAIPAVVTEFARSIGDEDAQEWTDRLSLGIARQGAAMLAEGGDAAGAAQRLRRVEAGLDGEAATVVAAERGAYLAQAGDLRSAGAILEEALPQLLAEDVLGVRFRCAGLWADALAAAGRVEEADRVWERFGTA